MKKIIRLSSLIYRRLLIFYPGEFRGKYGSEMADVFGDMLGDAIRRGGAAEIVSLWSSALWELFSIAVPLRLQNTVVIAGALSFVASSALFLAFFRAVQ
jgi:hypothetical protein